MRVVRLGILLLVITGLWFLGEGAAVTAALCLPVLAAVSWLLGLLGRRYLAASVQLPTTADKGSDTELTVRVKNRSWLPLGPVLLVLQAENQLTGEKLRFRLRVSAPPKGTGSTVCTLTPAHCGYLRVEVLRFGPMDWSGLLPVPGRKGGRGAVTVLPELFDTHVYLTVPAAAPDDSADYAPDHAGTDFSETYQLREYREGDSLRAIHWKLTGKTDKLIVRDPGDPIAKSLLVFWDKAAGAPEAEALDAMAEVTGSVCKALCEQGVSYHLGWSEGGRLVLEQIQNENDLLVILPRLIRHGGGTETGAATLLRDGSSGKYGRILYVSAALPEEIRAMGSRITGILWGENAGDAGMRILSIRPDTYSEDLRSMELDP